MVATFTVEPRDDNHNGAAALMRDGKELMYRETGRWGMEAVVEAVNQSLYETPVGNRILGDIRDQVTGVQTELEEIKGKAEAALKTTQKTLDFIGDVD